MSETTPSSKGPAPVQLTPETTEPVLISADQAKPEDIATLSIEYRDGQPVIVVSSGTYSPTSIRAVDAEGNDVASYIAAPRPRVAVQAFSSGIPVIAHPTLGLIESLGSAGIYAYRDDLNAWLDALQGR
ncbi:hypothetical protein ACFXG6_32815 [Streptomyces roseus]|uniref:hypothetical protein n=1 Tax=Streptomyces roseus TaxID=66430 RepID=UPI0036B94C48